MEARANQSCVVCSVLEADAGTAAARIESAPSGCRLVELRGDRLQSDALLRIVRQSTRELIVTLRPKGAGGAFVGSEEDRRSLLMRSLEAGARFVDVEWGTPAAALATGADRDRVILSHHAPGCELSTLRQIYREMSGSTAAVLKLVATADSVAQLRAVRDLLAEARRDRRDLACFAQGRSGAISRLLAPAWGSWATFGYPAGGSATAVGQFPVSQLLERYDVLGIGPATRRFALIGTALSRSPSPAMHAAGYRALGIDARYFPVELDEGEVDAFAALAGRAGLLGIEAFGVTMPFKEWAAARCVARDAVVNASGAVNTVVATASGWQGFNTDGPATLDAVCRHVVPRDRKVAIAGAGGMARAVALVLRDAGARVCIYNRDPGRARQLADDLGLTARAFDALASADWDILVNATPLGHGSSRVIAPEQLVGTLVVDAVYGARPTSLIASATEAGLATVDGVELLVGQAVAQFEHMTGVRPDPAVLDRAARLEMG